MKRWSLVLMILLVLPLATATADDPEHGWLGVSVGQAAGGKGVSVLDVVAGSPAEQTGLRPGDIIVNVDMQSVETPGGLASSIRELGPGTLTTLRVLRDGLPMTLDVKLTLAPSGGVWVQDPHNVHIHDVIRPGRVVEVTPDGDFLVQELDAAENLHFADAVVELIGDVPHRIDTETSIENGQMVIHTRAEIDGVQIDIVEEADGRIRVSRDGDERVYPDRKKFEAEDPEAARMRAHHVKLQDFFGPESDEHAFFVRADGADTNVFFHDDGELHEGHHGNMFFDADRTRRTYRVSPTGNIEVVITKGGNTLVREFTDADDLRDRDFDLYLHYEELIQEMEQTRD